MLRHVIIDILGFFVVILAGLALSNADQAEYANVLNHAGISEQAFVYHTKSTKKVSQAVQTLEKADLDDYQVQFAVTKKLTLFYAKGQYTSLPLVSGHFFTSADFDSSLPVAIVGSNVSSELYKAGEQSYMYRNGRYIPVIGVVGTRKGSKLNDHVFINASSIRKTTNPELKDVEIFVDGVDDGDTGIFTKTFGASPHRINVATTQTHHSFWQLYAVWIAALIGTALLMALIGLFAAFIMPRAQVQGLDAPLTNRYLWGAGANYLPGMGIAAILGTIIVWWQFYINNHFRLVLVNIVLFGIFVLTTQLFLHLRVRKEAK